MRTTNITFAKIGRAAVISALAISLTGCDGQNPLKAKGKPDPVTAATTAPTAGKTRDEENPKAYSVTDTGLWDGRPSLGGIWVAHVDVKDPERVIIRNKDNGKSITGALFRRERSNPGPKFMVSSQAAEKLGVLAGQPTNLSVIALRRIKVKPAPIVEQAHIADETPNPETAPTDPKIEAAEAIKETTLDPVTAAAGAGVDATPKPKAPAKPAFKLTKPYIQVGSYADQKSSAKALDDLKIIGMQAKVIEQTVDEKPIWRVVLGPYTSRKERGSAIKTLKGLGFADARWSAN